MGKERSSTQTPLRGFALTMAHGSGLLCPCRLLASEVPTAAVLTDSERGHSTAASKPSRVSPQTCLLCPTPQGPGLGDDEARHGLRAVRGRCQHPSVLCPHLPFRDEHLEASPEGGSGRKELMADNMCLIPEERTEGGNR